MIINEDYFDDLEIENKDIIDDDTLDVEEPNHDLTLEEAKKLSEQYDYYIRIRIDNKSTDTTFFQTSLLPRLFKRLDSIFELYGIKHSQYVLLLKNYDMEYYNTVVKFGNYQLFCEEDKVEYINDIFKRFYIQVYVNYPEFSYKRAFRFIYTMLNIFRLDKHITWLTFKPITPFEWDKYASWVGKPVPDTDDIQLNFSIEFNYIKFHSRNIRIYDSGDEINLSKELSEYHKRYFYKSVLLHFFKRKIRLPYKLIDRDVPFKPIIPR